MTGFVVQGHVYIYIYGDPGKKYNNMNYYYYYYRIKNN